MSETTVGGYPCLVAGHGSPLVVLAGLLPEAGVAARSLRTTHEATMLPWTRDRQVFYLNRRPDLPRGMTLGEIADEQADALRQAFDGPVDVMGLSTGGSIAQQLAAEHPDVVRRLVLISTGCRLVGVAKTDQRRAAARVRAGARRKAGALLAAAMLPNPRSPAGVLAAAVGWIAAPQLFSRQGLDDMATTIEAEDVFDLAELPAIEASTLVVGGGHDQFYPRELIEETVALIPGAQLEFVQDGGHVTVLAKNGVVARVLEFIAEPTVSAAVV